MAKFHRKKSIYKYFPKSKDRLNYFGLKRQREFEAMGGMQGAFKKVYGDLGHLRDTMSGYGFSFFTNPIYPAPLTIDPDDLEFYNYRSWIVQLDKIDDGEYLRRRLKELS